MTNGPLLEKAADILITQAQNLKSLIFQAKRQSRISKKTLLKELDKMNNSSTSFNDRKHSNCYNEEDNDLGRGGGGGWR